MQVTVLESHFNMVWFILWRPHHVRQDNQLPKVTQRIGSKLGISTQVTRLWKFQSSWLSKSILPYKGLTGIISSDSELTCFWMWLPWVPERSRESLLLQCSCRAGFSGLLCHSLKGNEASDALGKEGRNLESPGSHIFGLAIFSFKDARHLQKPLQLMLSQDCLISTYRK